MLGVRFTSLAALSVVAISLTAATPARLLHRAGLNDWKGAHRITPAADLLNLDVGAKVEVGTPADDAGSQGVTVSAKVELDIDLHAGFNSSHVTAMGMRFSSKSWEYGCVLESLLEVKDKSLSVFSPDAFPDGKIPNVNASDVDALVYVRPHIRLSGNTLVDGDGSAGDPASLGVGAILLGQRQSKYMKAATRQANHLLNNVPRNTNGAISMREAIVEQWADQLFMIPPFLAYYAVATDNTTLMSFVVDDIGRNRAILKAKRLKGKGEGLWEHIIGPQSNSHGIWSTGNGWVALGMVRVLATMQHWNGSATTLVKEQDQLRSWLYELLGGLEGVDRDSNGLFRNYIVGQSGGHWETAGEPWGGEVAGTAALAAAAYRLAALDALNAEKILPVARRSRLALAKAVDVKTGRVGPSVNPMDWHDRNYVNNSPEAQAFVAMLGAAYIDCRAQGPCTEANS